MGYNNKLNIFSDLRQKLCVWLLLARVHEDRESAKGVFVVTGERNL
jgi:hypothetical protein